MRRIGKKWQKLEAKIKLYSRRKNMPAKKKSVSKKAKTAPKVEKWKMILYVAGQTPNCVKAFSNLKKICEEHLKGQYEIQVIDLLENPQHFKNYNAALASIIARVSKGPAISSIAYRSMGKTILLNSTKAIKITSPNLDSRA